MKKAPSVCCCLAPCPMVEPAARSCWCMQMFSSNADTPNPARMHTEELDHCLVRHVGGAVCSHVSQTAHQQTTKRTCNIMAWLLTLCLTLCCYSGNFSCAGLLRYKCSSQLDVAPLIVKKKIKKRKSALCKLRKPCGSLSKLIFFKLTQEISTVMSVFHVAGLRERSIVFLYCSLLPGVLKLINAQTLSNALLSVEQQHNKQSPHQRRGKPVSRLFSLFLFIALKQRVLSKH